jgi:S1-C subfamily serine protease
MWLAILSLDAACCAQGLLVDADFLLMPDGSKDAEVNSVLRGGVAERVGVMAGDVILSINGFPPGAAAENQPAIAAGRGAISIIVNGRNRSPATLRAAIPWR